LHALSIKIHGLELKNQGVKLKTARGGQAIQKHGIAITL
jgi:hypothetical protein